MKLKSLTEIQVFLSTTIFDSESDRDAETIREYKESSSRDRCMALSAQAKRFAEEGENLLEDLGTEANRWFGNEDEARQWLYRIAAWLEPGADSVQASVVVKDSNGTVLVEGDSVTVIKDLKVKGGSSDLKRGTLIKKIHLIDDPDNIECRVDGSTLVLKTCFLKKA